MRFPIIAASAALFAGAVLAQGEDGAMAAHDADADGGLTREAFQTGFFQEWRRIAGGPDAMTEETFERSILGDSDDFAAFDENGDGMLTHEEYAAGVFEEYDGDGDARWSRAEAGAYDADRDAAAN